MFGTRAFFGVLALLCLMPMNSQTQSPTKGWPSADPGAVGLDGAVLAGFDADIAAGKYGYVDSMLVIRRGQVAYERAYKRDYGSIYSEQAKTRSGLNASDPTGPYNYFNPWWHPFYRGGDLHTMQSVTKTITSVVIGAAVARREFPDLDTPVMKFFDPAAVKNVDARKQRMTIRHLLTMTAGMDWNEDVSYNDPRNTTSAMEASFDWIQLTIDRPMSDEPGAVFRYNSGATMLLAHIFRIATSRDIEEYAHRHVFAPLGITQHFWKRTPTGLIDTEGGAYLLPRDLAKIGQLFLQNGVWDARPIVDPEWVRASTTPSITVSPEGTKYGFKWWLFPYGTDRNRLVWAANGFGGQRLLVIPEHELLVVYTGWNIVPGRPAMTARVAIDRVLAAVVK